MGLPLISIQSLVFGALAVIPVCGLWAEISDDLWFYEGFDRPAVMSGEILPHDVPESSYVTGRVGRACFFRREAKNVLLPTMDFLRATNSFVAIGPARLSVCLEDGTLSFSGGEMRFLPQSSGQGNSWASKCVSTTFAMEVKGRKDETLVLVPEVPELSAEDIRRIQKTQKSFSMANCQPTVAEARCFRLTGEWQCVWATATYDIRTRSVRRVGWRVKSDGAVMMRRFLQQGTNFGRYAGVDGPTEWVEGGRTRAEYHLLVEDPVLLGGFPTTNGTFSCWVRTPAGTVPDNRCVNAFTYQKGWDRSWSFDGGTFTTSNGWAKSSVHRFGPGFVRTEDWTHFAATWTSERCTTYLNGRVISIQEHPHLANLHGRGRFSIGGGLGGSADAILDEIAIFRRALTADEIGMLFRLTSGLLENSGAIVSTPPLKRAFARNHADAALKLSVDAPMDMEASLSGEIDGRAMPSENIFLHRGRNEVLFGFRAADWRAGKYPWVVRLLKGGKPVVVREGTLTILPAVERDALRIFCPSSGRKQDYALYRLIGCNALRPNGLDPAEINTCEEEGFRVLLRVENASDWQGSDFNFASLAAKVERQLRPFAGDPLWDMTRVNSEVYGPATAETVARYGVWCKIARKELGHNPVVAFSATPCGVDWKRVGMKCPRGILPRTDVYDTLEWFMSRGMPQLMMTRLAADVIRRLSPGNRVYSEPSPSLENLDVSSDWIYSYDPFACLAFLRQYSAWPRGFGKGFQPVLSMGYWSPDFMEQLSPHPTQRDPETGKPVTVMPLQTVDELKIKTMMCFAGAASDNIAFFSSDWGWGEGVTNGILHEKGLPLLRCPGWKKHCVAEKDAPGRFGAFIRERFLPAALLLRNLPNERAPVALLLPLEIGYSGEFWWPRVTYIRNLGRALSRQRIPYDVLFDAEFNTEALAKYRYVFYPQLNCITPAHDKVVRSLPEGTTFLHDENTFVAKRLLNYPNFESVKGLRQRFPAAEKDLDEPLFSWYEPRIRELRSRLSAWSEEDGDKAWTFTKSYKGARYVVVINNARRQGGCPQSEICTNATYRPMGTPQRITTHVRDGGIVYEFNSNGKGAAIGENGEIKRSYSAAESKVFCLYPKELTAPDISIMGVPRRGGEVELCVRMRNSDGNPAPGRQVVELTLTDSTGRMCDESGFYIVEDGVCGVAVRIPRYSDEPANSRWCADVRDLTSGLRKSMDFTVRGEE